MAVAYGGRERSFMRALGSGVRVGRGPDIIQAQQGDIHGNPASGNHLYMQLPTGTVTLMKFSGKYLPNLILAKTNKPRGWEGWEPESAMIHLQRNVAIEPQGSAKYATRT